MIDREYPKLSITGQCHILGIHRSGLYYKPCGESDLNLELMRKIDEEYLRHPFYGVGKMWAYLRHDLGYVISRKRVERLYRLMGLEALVPTRRTTMRNKGHAVYPYLLHEIDVVRDNQVWAMDITYIPMQRGFLYLAALIDLHSRYVVGWSLSNTMSADWCAGIVSEAIATHGTPEIINTDQGSKFTSQEFITTLADHHVKISMDAKGRAIDNIFIERLWKTIKYEHVYLRPASDGVELYSGLKEYLQFYNHERRHQSLGYKTPGELYRRAA